MNDLTVCFYTHDGFRALNRAIDSLTLFPDIPILVLHDKSNLGYRTVRNGVYVCEIPKKSSCAQLWNLGIMLSNTRYVMLCNDDIIFHDGWYEKFLDLKNEGFQYICMLIHSAFIIDKALIPKLGWADERFQGGGYEDCDLIIRGKREKINFIALPYSFDDGTGEIGNQFFAQPEWGNVECRWGVTQNKKFYKEKWGIDTFNWDKDYFNLEQKITDIDWHPGYTMRYRDDYC